MNSTKTKNQEPKEGTYLPNQMMPKELQVHHGKRFL